MKPGALAALVVGATLASGHAQPAVAQGGNLRHIASVYVDDKQAGLKLPEGIGCDDKGNIVVGDTGNDRLLRFTIRDKTVTGGSEIRIPELSAPSLVQISSKGEIYVLDGKRRRIVHLGADGGFRNVVAFENVPPPATIVPKSFKLDRSDNLYVLDAFSQRVLVLGGDGSFQKALPLPADIGFISDLAIDAAGNVLAIDAVKRKLFSASKDADAFAPLGGDLTESLTTQPAYMTTSKGTIFVVEGYGSSIVSFGRDGTFLTRQLSEGWKDGALNHPAQICINEKDEAFVADRDNSRVQVFALSR